MTLYAFLPRALRGSVLLCTSGFLAVAMALGQPRWIAPQKTSASDPDAPCPIMRSSFKIDRVPTRATVRVIGLGHYQLSLNGQQVGESVINQPWSEYNKTLYWQEFDILPLLHKGENAWGVLLGNSFWRVGPANDTMRYVKTDAMPDFSQGLPYLLWLEAKIRTEGGREVTVTSDETWKWMDGPLTFSNIYAGEDFDARRVPPGWDTPGFDDRSWRNVAAAPAPSAAREAFTGPPIRAMQIFQPERIVTPQVKLEGSGSTQGEYTYVFPQNCSALLRFTVEGNAGKTVRFKPCEYMDSTGPREVHVYVGDRRRISGTTTRLRGSGPSNTRCSSATWDASTSE